MTRLPGFDLSALVANADIREALAEAGGDAMLKHAARLAEVPLRGYGGARAEDPSATAELVSLAARSSFTHEDMRGIDSGRSWLLSNATLFVARGVRRLKLTPEARGRLLRQPQARAVLEEVLGARAEDDGDVLASESPQIAELTDVYIRVLLRGPNWYEHAGLVLTSDGSGQTIDLGDMEPLRRRALTEARRALSEVEALPAETPSLAECERLTALAELLDPLGLMVGLSEGSSGRGRDRFVGRGDALRALRQMVDALASESGGEAVSRTIFRTARSISSTLGLGSARMMVVSGHGGMGKSTLIAKFVLDHALSARPPIPFALLDFDRASLQPRNPASLLAEIARQVAFQFPRFEAEFSAFQREIEEDHAASCVLDLYERVGTLHRLIDGVLSQEGGRSFLLTIDTLEVVQADPQAFDSVCSLLRALSVHRYDRLCVVASGRSGGAELAKLLDDCFDVEMLTLQPFTVPEAREMVERLAERLMDDRWQHRWTARIVGGAGDPLIRREPLALRLAVEMVRDEDEEGREDLVRDIEEMGKRATRRFVGMLYETRILGHVRDPLARRLAWPGLIARTVTPDLARNVLAPICGLDADEVEHALAKLSHHGWIVERVGDVLHHRRDLRARTLPLMRDHDPKRFDEVLDALIAYFGREPNTDRIEQTYYRLLKGGEQVLAEAWPSDDLRALSGARDDLPRESAGRLLLDAANATRPLALSEMKRLRLASLWSHVARACATLRTLDDERLEERLLYLAETEAPEGAGDARAAWQFVQIKCGRWDRLDPHALVLPVAEEDTTLFAYYAHHLSWSRMVPAAQWAERYPALIERIGSERVQKNWHAIAEALAVARLYDPALAEWIDGTTRPRGESHWRRSAEISLRTLMIHGRRSREAAFPYWCKLEALRVRRGVSFRELALLGPALLSRGLLRPDSRRLGRTLASAPDREEGLVEDEEALAELSRAIAAWGDHQSPESHEIAARYCRIREPHWIVPMAYLLHPLLPAGWEQAIDIDALLGRRSSLFGGAFSSRTHRRALDDLILLLDLADRAGAFGRLADQLVAMADAGDRMLVKVRGRASDLEGDSAIAV